MSNYFTFKRTAIIFSSIFFVALFTWFFLFQKSYRSPFSSIHPIEAIPNHASIIIEFDNYYFLRDTLAKMPYSREMKGFSLVKKMSDDFKLFREIFSKHDDFQSLLIQGKVAASFHLTGGSNVDYLYVFKNKKKRLKVKELLSHFKYKESQRGGQKVYQLELENTKITIADFKGLFLISKHAYLVESGMQQLKSTSTNLWNKDQLKYKRNSPRKKNQVDLFVMFENLGSFANPFFQKNIPTYFENFSHYASSGHWVLDFQYEGIKIDGKLKPNFGNTLLQDVTSNTKKNNISSISILPDNLSYVFRQNIDKDQVGKNESKDFRKYFAPWVGEEWMIGRTEVFTRNAKAERFVVFHSKDIDKTKVHLEKMIQENGELKQWLYQTYPIKQVALNNLVLPHSKQGEVNIRNPYFTFVGDYVVFAGSGKVLESWIDNIIINETFAESLPVMQASSHFKEDAPMNFYWNNISSQRFFQKIINASNSSIKKQIKKLKSFPMVSFSAQWEKDHLATQGFVVHNKNVKESAKVRWRSNFKIELTTPPKALYNDERGIYEILVQDVSNTLYMLNEDGREIWRKELESPVQSDFHCIRTAETNGNVILFNTLDKIHMIDFEGDPQNQFPLKIKSRATNGLTVAKFAENDFGIFVATQSKNILGFNQKGIPIKGWEDIQVKEVYHPIQHFQTKEEDYFLVHNQFGDICFYDKNGDEGFSKKNYALKEPPLCILSDSLINCFYVSDKKGYMQKVCIGDEEDVLKENMDKSHQGGFFASGDFNSDHNIDFVQVKENDVKLNYQLIDSFNISGNHFVPCTPDEVFTVQSENQKQPVIGLVCKKKNRIYLLDHQLNQHPDFPLEGDSKFQLVPLFSKDTNVLLVGNKNQVIAYELPEDY